MDVKMMHSSLLKPKLFPCKHERFFFDKNNKCNLKNKINTYKKQHHTFRISATMNPEDTKSKYINPQYEKFKLGILKNNNRLN